MKTESDIYTYVSFFFRLTYCANRKRAIVINSKWTRLIISKCSIKTILLNNKQKECCCEHVQLIIWIYLLTFFYNLEDCEGISNCCHTLDFSFQPSFFFHIIIIKRAKWILNTDFFFFLCFKNTINQQCYEVLLGSHCLVLVEHLDQNLALFQFSSRPYERSSCVLHTHIFWQILCRNQHRNICIVPCGSSCVELNSSFVWTVCRSKRRQIYQKIQIPEIR